MTDETEYKIKVIKARDPASFERQYNAAGAELAKYDPEIKEGEDNGVFYALFKYSVHKQAPESVEDIFTLKGIRHTCCECPYLELGTDNRRKLWPCEYADTGITSKDSPACEKLLTDLMKGRVQLRDLAEVNDNE